MKKIYTLEEIENFLIDYDEDMKYEPDMKGITTMLHTALAPAFIAKHVKVVLKVEACESIQGIEYEIAQFQTETNLDIDLLKNEISNLPGCSVIFHFIYDPVTGKGNFISLDGVPISGEYEITCR